MIKISNPNELIYKIIRHSSFVICHLSFCFLFFPAKNVVIAQQSNKLSPDTQVSLVTILPGDELYSAFGHTAIRIFDPKQGIDWAYNYGTFDFNTSWFYLKFIRGLLDYQLSVNHYKSLVKFYKSENRPIIEQTLNLLPQEKDNLFGFLRTNYLPENRAYRYDFFFDNCSTRPRDVFEKVINRNLQFPTDPKSGLSFRDLIRDSVFDRPFTSFGIDLLFGVTTDRMATAREEMFLPIYLKDAFDSATIESEREKNQPFVTRTDTLFWSENAAVNDSVVNWPIFLFWSLLGISVLQVVIQYLSKTSREKKREIIDVIILGVIGIIGLFLLVMWFGTEHRVTKGNWNLLWAWPTHLAAAIFIFRRTRSKLLQRYLVLTSTASLAVIIGWNFWPQDFHPAILPFLLMMSLRTGCLAYAKASNSY